MIFRQLAVGKHVPRSAWLRRKASLASRAFFERDTLVLSIGMGVVTPETGKSPGTSPGERERNRKPATPSKVRITRNLTTLGILNALFRRGIVGFRDLLSR